MVLSEFVEFGPCIPAETVKACALIGLHMMTEENALRSDRDSSPYPREMWKYGCPKSPVWSDDGLKEERGEDASYVEAGHLCVEDVSTCLDILTLEASVNAERLTFLLGCKLILHLLLILRNLVALQ